MYGRWCTIHHNDIKTSCYQCLSQCVDVTHRRHSSVKGGERDVCRVVWRWRMAAVITHPSCHRKYIPTRARTDNTAVTTGINVLPCYQVAYGFRDSGSLLWSKLSWPTKHKSDIHMALNADLWDNDFTKPAIGLWDIQEETGPQSLCVHHWAPEVRHIVMAGHSGTRYWPR